ncbi:MAG TPA: hypothetical protein VLD83_18220 [Candidatus Binatia bacterium]|nr:hypothetical protein [Candidatus Binatia bacterium]
MLLQPALEFAAGDAEPARGCGLHAAGTLQGLLQNAAFKAVPIKLAAPQLG